MNSLKIIFLMMQFKIIFIKYFYILNRLFISDFLKNKYYVFIISVLNESKYIPTILKYKKNKSINIKNMNEKYKKLYNNTNKHFY